MRSFSFLSFLFSFMILKIVDGDGGGSGDGIADENTTDANVDKKDADENTDDKKDVKDDELEDSTNERIAELEKIVNDSENEKAVAFIVADIQTRYADFDESKITAHLKELKKSDPAEAKRMNNPLGWELLHQRNFAEKAVDNDYVGHGRGGESVDRTDEILEKVQKGRVSLDDEAQVLKKFM
ncbi:MAG: hypothetical protein GQ570_15155 [Helicobacteraceae bacterium]|nr:hypothetical protein [Helicobacteraceae bacterium]